MSKDLSTSRNRKKLDKQSFALPGRRKYPIPDKAHARNALARVAQHGSEEEQRTVRAAVHKKFPSIGTTGKKGEKGKKGTEVRKGPAGKKGPKGKKGRKGRTSAKS